MKINLVCSVHIFFISGNKLTVYHAVLYWYMMSMQFSVRVCGI